MKCLFSNSPELQREKCLSDLESIESARVKPFGRLIRKVFVLPLHIQAFKGKNWLVRTLRVKKCFSIRSFLKIKSFICC